MLWAIFTFYVPHSHKLLIPSSAAKNNNKTRMYSKRILSIQALWSLLQDFGICPMLCSRARLNTVVATLLTAAPSSQTQRQGHFDSPPPSKLNQSEAVLSFHTFYKVCSVFYHSPCHWPPSILSICSPDSLYFYAHSSTPPISHLMQVLWSISRDCLDQASVQWHPILLLLKLLNHMDTSAGRRKMLCVAGARDSRLLPPFSLNDPMFLVHAEMYRHRPRHSHQHLDSSSSSYLPFSHSHRSDTQTQTPTHAQGFKHSNSSTHEHEGFFSGWSPQSPEMTVQTPPTTSYSHTPSSSSRENKSIASLLKENFSHADTPLVGGSGGRSKRSSNQRSRPSFSTNISRPSTGTNSNSGEKKHQRNYVKDKIAAHKVALKRGEFMNESA